MLPWDLGRLATVDDRGDTARSPFERILEDRIGSRAGVSQSFFDVRQGPVGDRDSVREVDSLLVTQGDASAHYVVT